MKDPIEKLSVYTLFFFILSVRYLSVFQTLWKSYQFLALSVCSNFISFLLSARVFFIFFSSWISSKLIKKNLCSFGLKGGILEVVYRKCIHRHSCQIGTRVLQTWGVEKVVFWTFSKLFWSCLGSVWALFLAFKALLLGVSRKALKGILLGVFSLRKVDNWPRK